MPAYKDEKKGTWFVQCSYRDYTGSRIRTTKRGFSTRREALRWEKEFILKKEGALNMTMAAFYELYEADVKPSLKENTWNTKAHIIETKILPYLGDLRVNEITSADVLHWQNDVKELCDSSGQPLAQTYLRTISNQLSAMFNHAVRYYGLQANPMRRTGKMGSKKSSVEMKFWTRDEYLQFRRQVMDKPISFLAFAVLYRTGIREGELLALTPADFDARRSTLSISKSYQRIKGRDVVTCPKTPKSNRVITISPFLMEEVREYVKVKHVPKGERIFRLSKSFLYHEMRRGCALAGTKVIRIHDLRHSHVSLLIELGYSVPAIAERMGHEGVDITLHYAHLFPNKQAEMAADMERLNFAGEE